MPVKKLRTRLLIVPLWKGGGSMGVKRRQLSLPAPPERRLLLGGQRDGPPHSPQSVRVVSVVVLEQKRVSGPGAGTTDKCDRK